MIWIPLKTWIGWSLEERAQVSQHYESLGKKWAIALDDDPDYSKDTEEYREEMSLGGEIYKNS